MEGKSEHKSLATVTILVAIIGCIGVLGAAFINILPVLIKSAPTLPEGTNSFPTQIIPVTQVISVTEAPAIPVTEIPTIPVTESPAIATSPTISVPTAPLSIFEIVDVTSGRTYFKDKLGYGTTVYSDRDYHYNDIPSFLNGADYIITSNDDKFGGRDFDFQLTIFSNQEVIVYVAHSDRYTNKPDWLFDFQESNQDLTYYVDSDIVTLSLYQKRFPPGKIVLGGNVLPTESENHAMYTVVITASK